MFRGGERKETRGYRDRCITGLDYSGNKTRIHSRPRIRGIIKNKRRRAIKLASRMGSVHARNFRVHRRDRCREAIGTVSLSQLDSRNDDLMIPVNCVS